MQLKAYGVKLPDLSRQTSFGNVIHIATGKVGINTTVPEEQLDVNGTLQLRRIADADATTTLVASNVLQFQSAYWDGTQSVNQVATAQFQHTGTTPSGTLKFTLPTKDYAYEFWAGDKAHMVYENNAAGGGQFRLVFYNSGGYYTGQLDSDTGTFNIRGGGIRLIPNSAIVELAAAWKDNELHIRASDNTSFGKIKYSTTGGLQLSTDAGPIVLHPTGGNVGIGTTTPREQLDIGDGSIALTRGVSRIQAYDPSTGNTRAYIHFPSSGADPNRISFNVPGGGDVFVVGGTVANSVRVNGDAYITDNVGIGTTNPQAPLHIDVGNVSSYKDFIKFSWVDSYGNPHTNKIYADYLNTNRIRIGGGLIVDGKLDVRGNITTNGVQNLNIGTDSTPYGTVYTKNVFSGTGNNLALGVTSSSVVITTAGDVGIGITAPAATLHVNGTAKYRNEVKQVSGNYSLTSLDNRTIIEQTSSSASTITLPANIFSGGEVVTIVKAGTGDVTIAAGSGLTLHDPNSQATITTQWDARTVYFRSATEAVLI